MAKNFDLTIYKFSSVRVLYFKLGFRLVGTVVIFLILTSNGNEEMVSCRRYILL